MRLFAVLTVVLLAGCAGQSPDRPHQERPDPMPGDAAACATIEDVARSNLAVVLATVVWGLGPDGAIQSEWHNGTVEVLREGQPAAEVTLDSEGCGAYQPPSLGTYVFRAKPTEGSCSLAGNATIVQTADAGHVVRLSLSQPCA